MIAHEYAIIGHKRSEIGRWLGFASVVLAPIVTSLITWASNWPLLTASIQAKMGAFTLSTGLVYAALYWGFNRYGWRWLDKLLGIPNLGGSWTVTGQSLTLEGEIKFDWSGTLTITQKWDRIAIELKTAQSGSFSETASVLLKHDGAAKLSYSYQNHPRAGEPELQKHQGFCELTFDIDRSRAEGHYFNSMGRYSFGRMTLTRAAAPS
ncbi:MAG: pancortin-3 [Proteobacteria bacterium]|jgi:hypothetical protein|nr:pancortin-3 [Pseudomonadota bacterium]